MDNIELFDIYKLKVFCYVKMRRRSLSLPILECHQDFGSIIGTHDISLSPIRRSLVFTADKIDDNMEYIKNIVDTYNQCGKLLVLFIGMLGLVSILSRLVSGLL